MKKSWFSKKIFDNFFYQFWRQIFLTTFFYKKIILNVNFKGNAYGDWIFFQKFQKKILLGLKKNFPDVSWSSSGLFSNKQIFCHMDFILSSMCPDVLFFWEKFFNKFHWRLFSKHFFDKKIILNGHLEGFAYGESIFFLKFQKKF